MIKVRAIWDALAHAREQQVKRYTSMLTTIKNVVERTFMKKAKRVVLADAQQVTAVACLLEAQCVMAEEMDPEAMLTLSMRNDELNSFVAYMRQLDAEYRYLHDLVMRHESKTLQEAAKAGPDHRARTATQQGIPGER